MAKEVANSDEGLVTERTQTALESLSKSIITVMIHGVVLLPSEK
jgi:hypothetical protein